MTRSTPITFLVSAAVIGLLPVAVAACGGAGATADPPASTSAATTASTQTAAIRVANSGLGSILVDSQGRTLYLFKADSGTKSACTGECATAWPPLRTTGNPTAAGGASPTLVRTTPRSDGAPQVTYNGHPLYFYVGDKHPGDVNGQGIVAFGAAWYVVSPAGQQITRPSTSSPAGPPTSSPAGPPSGY